MKSTPQSITTSRFAPTLRLVQIATVAATCAADGDRCSAFKVPLLAATGVGIHSLTGGVVTAGTTDLQLELEDVEGCVRSVLEARKARLLLREQVFDEGHGVRLEYSVGESKVGIEAYLSGDIVLLISNGDHDIAYELTSEDIGLIPRILRNEGLGI